MSNYYIVPHDYYLAHHGIKGQKWGVRRFQNADGTLTDAGKRRIAKVGAKLEKMDKRYEKAQKKATREFQRANRTKYSILSSKKDVEKHYNKAYDLQTRADRYAYRGQEYYKRKAKKYSKITKLDPKSIELGKKFIQAAEGASRSTYSALEYQRMAGRK